MKAAIIAGGFGERIKHLLKETPKVLAPIAGTPFLEYIIRWLKKQGINEIVLCVGNKSELIEEQIGDGKKFGVEIIYSREEIPLGTGGALANAKKYLEEDTFLVINGDCIMDCDLQQAHNKHKEDGATSTIFLTEALNPEHQELIKFSKDGTLNISGMLQRGSEEHEQFINDNEKVYCNSGIYFFEPEIFSYMPAKGKFTLESMLFPILFSNKKKVIGTCSNGTYIEIGNPQLYAAAQVGAPLNFLLSIKDESLSNMVNVEKTIPLNKVVGIIQNHNLKMTLLGIGPMSELVVESAFELGKELDFPLLFIASRSQIDSEDFGGGYANNWNQRSFNEFVQMIKIKTGFHGLLYLCRDHGGPWQRPDEKSLSYADAMMRAKKSYVEDIKNGFNVLHLDPTIDPSLDKKLPLELVEQRTLDLLSYIEEKRRELGIPEISYEFGTDETSGVLTSFDGFDNFVSTILNSTRCKNLPSPAFIVGQTGTLVKMKRNIGKWDLPTAKKLTEITSKYGIGFKEHNGDYLPEEDLKLHSSIGITATNVAPEFGVAETLALLTLAAKEDIALKMGEDIESSNFFKILSEEVLKSNRWKKWLTPQERNLTVEQVEEDHEKKLEITLVAGHYLFANSKIKSAREQLYKNIKLLNIYSNPESYIKDFIKKSIRKYIEHFNLIGSTSKILNKINENEKI